MECLTPFIVKNNQQDEIPVPCGKCPACYARRVSQWSFRLIQEDKVSHSSHFITLTYATEHVPITARGFMDLSKRDLQLFFKRLRFINDKKIKYYAVGEYGGKGMRPHYHVILFNADLNTIQKAWQLGNVHYGQVTGASVGYTLKYMSKQARIPLHKNDDRTPEFGLMSKRLGISYMTPAMIKWHHACKHERMYVTTVQGQKVAMPRYYKDKIYDEHDRLVIGASARAKMLEAQAKLIESDPNYYHNKEQAKQAAFMKVKKQYKQDQSKSKI